jgi:hypothetical protein
VWRVDYSRELQNAFEELKAARGRTEA